MRHVKPFLGFVVLIVSSPCYAEAPQKNCVPNFEDGKPAGYKCFDKTPHQKLEKLELKNGDVIKEVDGQTVDNPSKGLQLLEGPSKTIKKTTGVQAPENPQEISDPK